MMLTAFAVVVLGAIDRHPLRAARPADPARRMSAPVAQPLRRRTADVDSCRVSFRTEEGVVQAVDGVSFTVAPRRGVGDRRRVGLGQVGEGDDADGPDARTEREHRGPRDARRQELRRAPSAELQRIRGAEIAMVFQDPMSSLDPVYRIGDQIVEQIRVHDRERQQGAGAGPRRELMERVGIPRARERCAPIRTSSPAACASA